MVSNYPSAISKTICVDLLNVSSDELQNLSFINPIVDTFFSFLFHKHKALHNDLFNEENHHLIYLEEDFIVGSKRHLDDFTNLSLGGFEILSDIKNQKIDFELYNKIESTMIANQSLHSNDILDSYFKSLQFKTENIEIVFSRYNDYIEVTNQLALSPEEIENQFKITTVFLNDEVKETQLTLNEIYYQGQYPIVFVYMDENSKKYMGWNKDYLIALEDLPSINGNTFDKEATLNTILDKINKVGLKNLNEKEIFFLDNFSSLD